MFTHYERLQQDVLINFAGVGIWGEGFTVKDVLGELLVHGNIICLQIATWNLREGGREGGRR